jgi:hypothetical protein
MLRVGTQEQDLHAQPLAHVIDQQLDFDLLGEIEPHHGGLVGRKLGFWLLGER